MELCNPQLKYSVFYFVLNLEFQNRTDKSLVFILSKLQTGLPKNDNSIRYVGKNYFSYLKLPHCLRKKLQVIKACV